jgi:DNA-binding helix-hairpin-helix protein with protein kinase domain
VPAQAKFTDTVKMRLFSDKEGVEQKVKDFLRKYASVKDVRVEDGAKAVTFTFSGTMNQLKAIESDMRKKQASCALVSRAFVSFAMQGATEKTQAALKSSLKSLQGVKDVCDVTTREGEIVADLSQFSVRKLIDLGKSHEIKITVRSHEEVRIDAKGENLDEYVQALAGMEGVLNAKMDGDCIDLLTLKSVADGVLRRNTKQLQVEVKKIERIS